MREEIFNLANKCGYLKHERFKGFKTNKDFEINSVFNNTHKVLVLILLLIISVVIVLMIKFKAPILLIAVGILFLIYTILSTLDSIINIRVDIKNRKLIIKKITKKYKINFDDIDKIYLVSSSTIKGLKSKIRILFENNGKIYNLSLETAFLKTKDIKSFITQIESEEEKKKEIEKQEDNKKDNKKKAKKKIEVDETILSNLDLFMLVILAIIFLIDIAI